MEPVPVPKIMKLLIILTVGVQMPDSSGSPTHEEEPVLAAQPEPLEASFTRPTSFSRAGALLRVALNAATEQTCQGGQY